MGGQEVEQEVVLACVKDIIGQILCGINLFNTIKSKASVICERFCESISFSAHSVIFLLRCQILFGQITWIIQFFSDTIDEDGDGNITKDEFVKNATKSDFIKSLVTDE